MLIVDVDVDADEPGVVDWNDEKTESTETSNGCTNIC